MKNKVISTSAFILLCGFTAAYAENTTNQADADGIVWGEAVNGLQLGISPPVDVEEADVVVRKERPLFDGSTLHVAVHLRHVGETPVRFLPSIWSCLAMGTGGAIPVSTLVLEPEGGGDALTVTYQGSNHLRLLDTRRSESESWQETLCKSAVGGEGIQLKAEDADTYQVELADGDTPWPEPVEFTPGKNSNSLWRLTEEANRVPDGKYRITAVLIVDQAISEWKGKLTSGSLPVEFDPPKSK